MKILDTNMIIRYLIRDNEDMAEQAKHILKTEEVFILPEVIAEVILNDIANCTIDVERILHITRRRRKAYLLYGDDDNAVMCKIFRQICVICNGV